MTDRVAATGDSAQACPFVAFEDERDDRSERPDPRHRCYAETPPAPRGRSHQETYCLSSAFPACPTFQAWARREAARVQVARDAQESAAVRLRDVPAQRESAAGRDAAAAGLAASAAGRNSVATTGDPAAAAREPAAREPSSVPPIVPARDLVSNQDLANEAPEDRGRAALEVALAGGATRAADAAGGTSTGSSISPSSSGRPPSSTDGAPSSSITALPPPSGGSHVPSAPVDDPGDWSASDLARATPPPRRPLTDDDDDLASLLGRPPSTDRSDSGYDRSTANSVPPDLAQRRPAQGQWSAPPPWAGGPRPASEGGDPTSPGAGRPPSSSSTSRSTDPYPDGLDANGRRVVVERPPASRSSSAGAGLAESAAAGAVVAGVAGSAAAGASGAGSSAAGAVSPMAPWEADDLEPVAPLAPPQRSSSLATLLGWDRRPRAGSPRPARMASQAEPPWERPRRYEAYPTIRTRVGLPAMSKAALAGIALLVGALALFFLPPLLLHQGGAAPGASESIAPSSSVGPSHSVGPTVAPAKTPLTYTVKSGDTLVKIAKKYNLTVEQLLAANKQIKNPNKIAIGDVLNIPQSTPSQIIDGGPSGSP